MNKQAIEHKHESRYSFYLDNNRCLIRVRTARNDTIKKVEVLWNEWCQFYKHQNTTILTIAYEDDLFAYYEGIISSEKPSYEYIIKITDGDGKIYYLCDEGLVEKFDFQSSNQLVFMAKFPNESDIVRKNEKLSGRIFYQIFPERFACSDFSKPYISMKWDTKKVDNNHYLGGDLQGIIAKIPYLKQMGIGGIYLTPIHPAGSAHKYDINDYFDIDPMFGNFDDFDQLIKVCHANDITLVMDMVFNHCSYYNVLFQDVVKNGKKSKYYDWFFVDGDKPDYDKKNYLTFANVRMMPKLNTNNPEVLEYFKKVLLFWANKGVDGFRLDVAFEISYQFWRALKFNLLSINKDIFFIGEDWLNTVSRLDNSQWDSVMNYPFRYALLKYLTNNEVSNEWFSNRLNSLFVRYINETNNKVINLVDSHDTERLINRLGFDQNKFLLAFAILMFYPGVPQIYYGDEIFMEGNMDPDCRRGMEWNSKEFESENHKFLLEILKLRNLDSLKFGNCKFGIKNEVSFISRWIDNESYTLYFSNKAVDFDCKGSIILKHNFTNNRFDKFGFIVIKNK